MVIYKYQSFPGGINDIFCGTTAGIDNKKRPDMDRTFFVGVGGFEPSTLCL